MLYLFRILKKENFYKKFCKTFCVKLKNGQNKNVQNSKKKKSFFRKNTKKTFQSIL